MRALQTLSSPHGPWSPGLPRHQRREVGGEKEAKPRVTYETPVGGNWGGRTLKQASRSAGRPADTGLLIRRLGIGSFNGRAGVASRGPRFEDTNPPQSPNTSEVDKSEMFLKPETQAHTAANSNHWAGDVCSPPPGGERLLPVS